MIEEVDLLLPCTVKGKELIDVVSDVVKNNLSDYKVKVKDIPIDLSYGLVEKEIRIVKKSIISRLGFVSLLPDLGRGEMDIDVFPEKDYEFVKITAPQYFSGGDLYLGSEAFDENDAKILINGIREEVKKKCSKTSKVSSR